MVTAASMNSERWVVLVVVCIAAFTSIWSFLDGWVLVQRWLLLAMTVGLGAEFIFEENPEWVWKTWRPDSDK